MSKNERLTAQWLGVLFVLALLYWHMKRKVTLFGIQGLNQASGMYEPGVTVNPPVSGPGLPVSTWTDHAPQELGGKGLGEYGQTSNEPHYANYQYSENPSNRGYPASDPWITARDLPTPSNPLSMAQEALQLLNSQSFMDMTMKGY